MPSTITCRRTQSWISCRLAQRQRTSGDRKVVKPVSNSVRSFVQRFAKLLAGLQWRSMADKTGAGLFQSQKTRCEVATTRNFKRLSDSFCRVPQDKGVLGPQRWAPPPGLHRVQEEHLPGARADDSRARAEADSARGGVTRPCAGEYGSFTKNFSATLFAQHVRSAC